MRLLALLLVTGCTAQGLPGDEQVSSLRFTTSTEIAANPPPPLNLTVTNREAARAAYQATTMLARFAGGVVHCPPDLGVHYQVSFYSDDSMVLQADVEPSGCGVVQLEPENSARATTSAYFATLADALQVSEAQIYPYAPPH